MKHGPVSPSAADQQQQDYGQPEFSAAANPVGRNDLRTAVAHYVNETRVGLSPRATGIVRQDLCAFIIFLEQQGITDVAATNLAVLDRYAQLLTDSSLATRSQRRKIAAICHFWAWVTQTSV